MKQMDKIRIAEAVLFFIGWTAVMLLGADFPPPAGFVWILVAIGIIDVFQWLYSKWLLREITRSRTFFRNLLVYAGVGLAASSIFLAFGDQDGNAGFSAIAIWLSVCTAVAAVYGILFWCLNLFLMKRTGRQQKE